MILWFTMDNSIIEQRWLQKQWGLSVKTTRVYHINNGYVYYFQFSGTTSDKYYKDFESLLDSVKYENLYGPKLFLGATIK